MRLRRRSLIPLALVIVFAALPPVFSDETESIRIDPGTPPPEFSSMPNGPEAWAKMIEHVPEFPEAFLLGRWSTVSREDARKYPLLLQLHLAEVAAILQGKTVTDHERKVFADLTQLNAPVTTLYSGHLSFGKDRAITGELTSGKSGKVSRIEGDWLFQPGGKVQTRVIGDLFNQLSFAEGRRLVFYDRGILIVLEKD